MTIPLPSRYRLDPDLMTWVARCKVLPDINFLFAANPFIQAGKAAGWWDLLSAIYFFCAPNQQAALQNVKGNKFNLVVNTSGSATRAPLLKAPEL